MNVAPSKLRIVVVEDQTLVREGMIAMLEASDDVEVVGQADNGTDGLSVCIERKPDVVLLDLGLPDIGGLEVLQRLKQTWPEVRVIVVTVHDEQGYVGDAMRAGADGYMLKTSSYSELTDAVRRVVRGEPVLHPAVAKRVLHDFVSLSKGERPEGELSAREREVVQLLAQGKSNRQIADQLTIGVETVKSHVSNIMEKLGATDRTHAVVLALRRGLVQ